MGIVMIVVDLTLSGCIDVQNTVLNIAEGAIVLFVKKMNIFTNNVKNSIKNGLTNED